MQMGRTTYEVFSRGSGTKTGSFLCKKENVNSGTKQDG
jgi:hypothetical protein